MRTLAFICRVFWFAVAALEFGTPSVEAQTWIQWSSAQGGNNHYYALTTSATNWDAAEKQAVAWGGTLATITSSNEQEFINETFLTGKFEHLPLWIGLTGPPAGRGLSMKLGSVDVQVHHRATVDFEWVTGEPLSYTNWKPGEPSNTPPGENYVAINWDYARSQGVKGDWNDTPLNGTTGYAANTDGPYFGIVERDPTHHQVTSASFSRSAIRVGLWALLAAVLILILVWCNRKRRPEARH